MAGSSTPRRRTRSQRSPSATGIPVADTQAGKGSLLHDHPQRVGAVGSTGTTVANGLARDADLVIGVGTRYTDFTTASRTAFRDSGVRFVSLNVAGFDAGKHSGLALVADAREGLTALTDALDGWAVEPGYAPGYRAVEGVGRAGGGGLRPTERGHRPAGPGAAHPVRRHRSRQRAHRPRDVVVCAAGSMPGDLHKLWRVRDRKGYHVEYGYSCMGYEIPGALGVPSPTTPATCSRWSATAAT